jgi:hypothetical protein
MTNPLDDSTPVNTIGPDCHATAVFPLVEDHWATMQTAVTWDAIEYVIGLAAGYLYLAHAAADLVAE